MFFLNEVGGVGLYGAFPNNAGSRIQVVFYFLHSNQVIQANIGQVIQIIAYMNQLAASENRDEKAYQNNQYKTGAEHSAEFHIF